MQGFDRVSEGIRPRQKQAQPGENLTPERGAEEEQSQGKKDKPGGGGNFTRERNMAFFARALQPSRCCRFGFVFC